MPSLTETMTKQQQRLALNTSSEPTPKEPLAMIQKCVRTSQGLPQVIYVTLLLSRLGESYAHEKDISDQLRKQPSALLGSDAMPSSLDSPLIFCKRSRLPSVTRPILNPLSPLHRAPLLRLDWLSRPCCAPVDILKAWHEMTGYCDG